MKKLFALGVDALLTLIISIGILTPEFLAIQKKEKALRVSADRLEHRLIGAASEEIDLKALEAAVQTNRQEIPNTQAFESVEQAMQAVQQELAEVRVAIKENSAENPDVFAELERRKKELAELEAEEAAREPVIKKTPQQPTTDIERLQLEKQLQQVEQQFESIQAEDQAEEQQLDTMRQDIEERQQFLGEQDYVKPTVEWELQDSIKELEAFEKKVMRKRDQNVLKIEQLEDKHQQLIQKIEALPEEVIEEPEPEPEPLDLEPYRQEILKLENELVAAGDQRDKTLAAFRIKEKQLKEKLAAAEKQAEIASHIKVERALEERARIQEERANARKLREEIRGALLEPRTLLFEDVELHEYLPHRYEIMNFRKTHQKTEERKEHFKWMLLGIWAGMLFLYRMLFLGWSAPSLGERIIR